VIRADDPDAPVLEPKLTAHDQRVLGLLPVLSTVVHGRWTGRSAWEVAEALRADDVADVRRVLDGLVHFGYAIRGRSWSRNLNVYGRREDRS
jgi:hypothetical protein